MSSKYVLGTIIALSRYFKATQAIYVLNVKLLLIRDTTRLQPSLGIPAPENLISVPGH